LRDLSIREAGGPYDQWHAVPCAQCSMGQGRLGHSEVDHNIDPRDSSRQINAHRCAIGAYTEELSHVGTFQRRFLALNRSR
jgi:hypothetical protein